jgi:glutamate N-acetyltransferase/amino-acid N-acetyltransferase
MSDAPSVPGFVAGGVATGSKKKGAKDLALIFCPAGAAAAGVLTTNKIPAPPVQIARAVFQRGSASAIVANSGCANAYTGRAGTADARVVMRRTAKLLGLHEREVIPASTGVIGQRLPVTAINRALPQLATGLSPRGWLAAADAIRTTDTRPKVSWQQCPAGGGRVQLVGIAKGAGMIEPHMATLLVFLATNARIRAPLLRRLLKNACDQSFNRLTIDGCMSTNDMATVLASGEGCPRALLPGERDTQRFAKLLIEVCRDLANQLAADGEGATKRVRIRVEGASSDRQAGTAAYALGNSLLVKTALHGEDPNWGRIVQALGASGVRLNAAKLGITIGKSPILSRGVYGGAAVEARARRTMQGASYEICVKLGVGRGRDEILTCDLSAEYVRINASYRS